MYDCLCSFTQICAVRCVVRSAMTIADGKLKRANMEGTLIFCCAQPAVHAIMPPFHLLNIPNTLYKDLCASVVRSTRRSVNSRMRAAMRRIAVAQPFRTYESNGICETGTLQPIANMTPPPVISISHTVLVVHSPNSLVRMDAVR